MTVDPKREKAGKRGEGGKRGKKGKGNENRRTEEGGRRGERRAKDEDTSKALWAPNWLRWGRGGEGRGTGIRLKMVGNGNGEHGKVNDLRVPQLVQSLREEGSGVSQLAHLANDPGRSGKAVTVTKRVDLVNTM